MRPSTYSTRSKYHAHVAGFQSPVGMEVGHPSGRRACNVYVGSVATCVTAE